MSIVLFLFLCFKYHIQLALYCTTEANVLCTCWPYKKSCSVIQSVRLLVSARTYQLVNSVTRVAESEGSSMKVRVAQ